MGGYISCHGLCLVRSWLGVVMVMLIIFIWYLALAVMETTGQ